MRRRFPLILLPLALLPLAGLRAREGQQAKKPPKVASQPTAEEAQDDPIRIWFDRHTAFLYRRKPVQARFEEVIFMPGDPQPVLREHGTVAYHDFQHYDITYTAEVRDPTVGERVELQNRMLADGTVVWLVQDRSGPEPMKVSTRTLDLLQEAKATLIERGMPTKNLDPLDLVFNYGNVRSSFLFEDKGSREEDGRKVMVFEGRIRPRDELGSEMQSFYDSGVRTAEMLFDAVTGLVLSSEMRGDEGVFAHRWLSKLEFPHDLHPGSFHYEPPPGVSVDDQDAALEQQLRAVRESPSPR